MNKSEPPIELLAAAQAVIDRWDSPSWKDLPATADYIHRLRKAVTGTPQPLPEHLASTYADSELTDEGHGRMAVGGNSSEISVNGKTWIDELAVGYMAEALGLSAKMAYSAVELYMASAITQTVHPQPNHCANHEYPDADCPACYKAYFAAPTPEPVSVSDLLENLHAMEVPNGWHKICQTVLGTAGVKYVD